MGKYIKYEIKGSYQFIFGIIAILLIASTVIQFNIEYFLGNSLNQVFFMVLPAFIIFGAYITAFFYIIGSFRKELYEDRGYLTFALPLSGNQILGAKLFVAMTWFLLLGMCMLVYNGFLAFMLHTQDSLAILRQLGVILRQIEVYVLIFASLLNSISLLLMIYFSMTLSRVTIKNKKIGGFWFIIFLVLSTIDGFLSSFVNKIFPYSIDFTTWKIFSTSEITGFDTGIGFSGLLSSPGMGTYDIASLVLTILLGVGMFYATSYLIEKRIDL